MSKLFLISEEEKNRILNLHESATKNLYLMEQIVTNYDSKYDYKKEGNNYYYKVKSSDNWILSKGNASTSIKDKVFNQPIKTNVGKSSKFDIKNKEFFTQTKDTTGDTMRSFNQHTSKMIEAGKESIKLMGKISEKTHKQLVSMMTKGYLKKDTFIVINKDNAIATLFGPNYKFIGKSSITTGKVKDVKPIDIDKLGYSEWREQSIDFSKTNPTHPDSIKINKWIETAKTLPGLINKNGDLDNNKYEEYVKNKKINGFPYSYTARKYDGTEITPGGVYKLGSGHSKKGYASSDTKNTFPLITISGEYLPNAIHGYAGKQRGDLIKQFSNQDVNASKDLSRAGSGCVNVDENFIKLVNQYKPKYVVILPDSGQLVDVKIVTMETWSEKIASLGEKCVKSLISFFT